MTTLEEMTKQYAEHYFDPKFGWQTELSLMDEEEHKKWMKYCEEREQWKLRLHKLPHLKRLTIQISIDKIILQRMKNNLQENIEEIEQRDNLQQNNEKRLLEEYNNKRTSIVRNLVLINLIRPTQYGIEDIMSRLYHRESELYWRLQCLDDEINRVKKNNLDFDSCFKVFSQDKDFQSYLLYEIARAYRDRDIPYHDQFHDPYKSHRAIEMMPKNVRKEIAKRYYDTRFENLKVQSQKIDKQIKEKIKIEERQAQLNALWRNLTHSPLRITAARSSSAKRDNAAEAVTTSNNSRQTVTALWTSFGFSSGKHTFSQLREQVGSSSEEKRPLISRKVL